MLTTGCGLFTPELNVTLLSLRDHHGIRMSDGVTINRVACIEHGVLAAASLDAAHLHAKRSKQGNGTGNPRCRVVGRKL